MTTDARPLSSPRVVALSASTRLARAVGTWAVVGVTLLLQCALAAAALVIIARHAVPPPPERHHSQTRQPGVLAAGERTAWISRLTTRSSQPGSASYDG